MLAPAAWLFMVLYLISFMFVLGCEDWLMIWLGLEINMISFICLIFQKNDSTKSELCLKYFFIQSLASGIFMSVFYLYGELVQNIGVLVLSYSMGAAPFFFWFPSLCDSMGWMSCFFLMSFQKFIPLYLVSFLIGNFLWVIVVASMIVGAFGSFNQISLSRLFAYSSIHHIGWMIVGMFAEGLWLMYLMMYSFMIFVVINFFKKEDVILIMGLASIKLGWNFVFNMLSMGGMPPMLGFFMKWYVFYSMNMLNGVLYILMVVTSVIMFYVYLRVLYDVMMGSKYEVGWSYKSGISMNYIKIADMFSLMGFMVFPVMWMVYMM